MGTHASISVKHTDGKYYGVYVHFDGYPEHTLRILRNHYNSQELAEELVSYGDASSISETIETCEFYCRDRGEDGMEPKVGDTWSNLLVEIAQGYDYIYANGKWDVIED